MRLDLDAIFNPDRDRKIRVVPEPTVSVSPMESPNDLPTDRHFEWDERAAIMEYEGGIGRERAEYLALLDVVAQIRGEPRPGELEVKP